MKDPTKKLNKKQIKYASYLFNKNYNRCHYEIKPEDFIKKHPKEFKQFLVWYSTERKYSIELSKKHNEPSNKEKIKLIETLEKEIGIPTRESMGNVKRSYKTFIKDYNEYENYENVEDVPEEKIGAFDEP